VNSRATNASFRFAKDALLSFGPSAIHKNSQQFIPTISKDKQTLLTLLSRKLLLSLKAIVVALVASYYSWVSKKRKESKSRMNAVQCLFHKL